MPAVSTVGLTGGIGAGKSAVSARLAERGAVLIDSDLLAREVVQPGSPGLAAVGAEFGTGILTADGQLDRPKLGALVFADPGALARLNAIVHPLVRRRSAELAEAAGPAAVILHDVPLLVENGLAAGFDLVVVVWADIQVRLERLRRDRGMSESEARSRMANQATDEQRRAVADVVIDNSGTRQELLDQVDRLWTDRLAPAAR